MKPIENIELYSRNRAINAIIFCIIVAATVFIGVSIRLLMPESEYVSETGLETYRMFTVESNIMVACFVLLCIPYEIDGLRNRDYHMPNWIIYILYMATTVVALTMLVAGTILSAVAGFRYIMLEGSNLYLHTLSPILTILFFIQIANDHHIRPKFTWLALAPIFLYAVVYIVMCFVLGEDNGGWPDHYKFDAYIPWPLTMAILFAIALIIATLLRLAHNKVHTLQKERYQAYYMSLECDDIAEAAAMLARHAKSRDPGDNDIVVPRRVFRIMEKRYHSGRSLQELCDIYLANYLGQPEDGQPEDEQPESGQLADRKPDLAR